MTPLGILFSTTFSFTLVYLCLGSRRRPALPYPPGPRKLPFIGNMLDLPTSNVWLTYARWSKKYKSDILHVQAAGNNIVIIHSYDVASDLLDKKSINYGSRPVFTMVNDLMGWDWFMPTMVYGKPWKDRRRVFHQYFQASNAATYRRRQLEFVHQLLPRLLDSPEDLLELTSQMVAGMILSLAYGLNIKPSNDPWIALAKTAVRSVADAAHPGAFLVDILPVLKHVPEFVPGAGFQRQARLWRETQQALREQPFAETVQNMAAGTARPSFTSASLENIDESMDHHHEQQVIKDVAATMYGAGVDTTVSTIHTFFLVMICFPGVQASAQEEIDRVLGHQTLPDFCDEEDLPYVSALIREILRWQPTLPLTVQCAREDGVYGGYYIPKGSLMLANIWAMLHNAEDYPDPSSFKPERFLKDGKLNPNVRDPTTIAFGFGRRICPGNHVALSTLWLTAVSVLAMFTISKAVNEDGSTVEPTIEYSHILVRQPLPFKCTIQPRSSHAEFLMRSIATEIL